MAGPDPRKQREEALLWLRKAERDLAGAQAALQAAEPLPDIAAYHVQQAAEKLLKSLLTAHAVPFRRTHDLDELGEQATTAHPVVADVVAPVRIYGRWNFAFRYPPGPADAEPEPTVADVEAALAKVMALRDAVLDLLGAAT